jgi:hypothetical protein
MLEPFIPVADNPSNYREVNEPDRRASLEYSLLRQALLQTGFRDSVMQTDFRNSVQGMYVITPSGKVISGGNRPCDIEFVLECLRKGLETYQSMPRAERLLARTPDPKADRIFPERATPRPPADGLVLRVAGRGFDESISDATIWRESPLAPRYYAIDRLWYTREEAMQFLPDQLTRGKKKEVTGPVLEGMAVLYLIANKYNWQKTHIKVIELSSEVVEAGRRTVKVKLSGHAVFDANDQFNQHKYRPDILGYATFDTVQRTFIDFDLVAYGPHTVGGPSLGTSEPKYIPMGFVFQLNGSNPNDNVVPTDFPMYGWAKLGCGR